MISSEERPLIFDIKHFALDDGPGIRTTVFLKGCPLACQWCQNPESIESGPEIAFYAPLCINCGDCQMVCPEGAIHLNRPARIDRAKCTKCSKCVDECPTTALKTIGKYYSVEELVDILTGDHIFYETSNGGVTFSGGEPTLHIDYVGEVMKVLKSDHIHIAIQTSGMFDMSAFKSKLLQYIDLIFYDIKFINSHLHKKYTNRTNLRILNNFLDLARETSVQVIPRVPLIPEITTVTKNLIDIADFLKSAGYEQYQLLSYNPGGVAKKCYTGKPNPSSISNRPSDMEKDEEWKRIFTDRFVSVL